ncbi:unnamed protein product, partial [Effrenium voratum]
GAHSRFVRRTQPALVPDESPKKRGNRAMGVARCCCCLCCPCCFLLGWRRVLALLGAVLALGLALLLGPVPLDLADEAADLCEAAAWFMDTRESYTYSTEENLNAWAQVCPEAFRALPPAAQQVLRSLRAEGKHRREEVLRDKGLEEKNAHWPAIFRLSVENGTLAEDASLPHMVPLKEIPQAFAAGKVVRFNASELLPPHMFNSSLAEIRKMHTEENMQETLVYGSLGGGSFCRILALWPVTKAYRAFGRTQLFEAFRRLMVAVQRICPLKPIPFYLEDLQRLKPLGPSNINMKRLANFDGRLQVPEKLGLTGVEGMLSMLWLGVSPFPPTFSLHTDVQDNVLMELVSETNVYILPRDLCWDSRSPNETVTGKYLKVHLVPGEGLAIPSNFLHTVEHLHQDRLGVNYFFEPKFGEMQWPNGPKGNWYAEIAKSNKEHLAMRALWFKSVGLLWEKHHKGIAMHGWKMEVL